MADIAIRQLHKSYNKDEVLHGIDLDVKEGEFVCILGPSGCGKSTLLRMIAGLEEVSSGSISIDGKRVNDLEPRKRGCAMVFQNYALYPHMSVAQNIGYALKVAGVSKTERNERVNRIAHLVGLDEFLDRKPDQLSGGQRQRVAMARAVIREPGVFLFDEPLSNLDAKLRVQMRHEIRRIHNRIKATSIFVTHDQQEGMTLSDRMVIMNKGSIVQIGTPEEIYQNPASIFVAEFVGSFTTCILDGQIRNSKLALDEGAPLSLTGPKDEHEARKVKIGLRPEDLELVGEEEADLTGAFDFAEELGLGRLYHMTHQDRQISVQTEKRIKPKPGDHLGIRIKNIHLFDEAGKRLENLNLA